MQGTRVRAVTQVLVLFHFFPFQPSYHYWGHFCLLPVAVLSQVSGKAKGIAVVWPCFTKGSGIQGDAAGRGGRYSVPRDGAALHHYIQQLSSVGKLLCWELWRDPALVTSSLGCCSGYRALVGDVLCLSFPTHVPYLT